MLRSPGRFGIGFPIRELICLLLVSAGARKTVGIAVLWNMVLDAAFKEYYSTAEAVGGWNTNLWGQFYKPRAGISFAKDVQPALLEMIELGAQPSTASERGREEASDFVPTGRLEFIRLMINHSSQEDFYRDQRSFLKAYFYSTEAVAEIQTEAGGNPAAMFAEARFMLPIEKKEYLKREFGLNADPFINYMNAKLKEVVVDDKAVAYATKHWEIPQPLPLNEGVKIVTLHAIYDDVVPVESELALPKYLQPADRSASLLQLYTEAHGHCGITSE